MIFNSFEFLFLFLPAALLSFHGPGHGPGLRRLRVGGLLLLSLLFYGFSGWLHAAVLIVNIAWVWLVTRPSTIEGDPIRLILAISPPLISLFYFKYLGFFLGAIGAGAMVASAEFSLFSQEILPAGISFFTFQIIAYAIDRYRREIPRPPSLARFALFISFFPQLVAGPILRYRDFQSPLFGIEKFSLNSDDAARALGYLSLGLAVKVLLADTLGHYITMLTANMAALGKVAVIFVIFSYSFQLYFDFYGYSLAAIGLGTFFGFRLPDNFLRPYESKNIREFWRRWHVTLSFWIRDYLYLPLGGNRSYIRNIIIIFAVCGLWHGAGWNFLIWGLAHGGLVAAYHWRRAWWDTLPHTLQTILTFVIVSVLWLLFLFDFPELGLFLSGAVANGWQFADVQPEMWLMLGVAALVCFGPNLESIAENRDDGTRRALARNIGLGLTLVAVLVFLDRSGTFIYFRF
ncbi:MAG: MBOAT family protein [Alphaproteobacteria bacterium]|nr:MBOAT family protein [Alphaproteobacteria bacterium]